MKTEICYMTAVVDDVPECISVEVIQEKAKSVISYIYRVPGCNTERFKD